MRYFIRLLFLTFALTLPTPLISAKTIPLPEHPRPDFEREEWINLNGQWGFTFDETIARQAIAGSSVTDRKKKSKAASVSGLTAFDKAITVPFPWGSPLSGVDNEADRAWYGRELKVPANWKGKRVFLVIGAADWETTAWLNGVELGVHQGGYTPFEFELTDHLKWDGKEQLIIGADDTPNNQHLGGKQGYGNARGIWQTVYLEARGDNYIEYVHFTPDIDNSKVRAEVKMNRALSLEEAVRIDFLNTPNFPFYLKHDAPGTTVFTVDIPILNQQLWTLDDPFLYEMAVTVYEGSLSTPNPKPARVADRVKTYFGQRKISVVNLPGTDYPYVALNDKPVYLQMCLDQSYHPEGYYTFPSDEFMKNEILISKKLGLNGNRIHIKVEVPRKLYWADKLGLLIMADVPNWWGPPGPEARKDWEYCMRQMIRRDYNHPSIFSWVDFNETWGLFENPQDPKFDRRYVPETQEWVRDMFHETKKLDGSRLVEDNSPTWYDHVATDLNTWHAYLPGYAWADSVRFIVENTYEGSSWNFIGDNVQGRQPMFNSECGNVWGYKGSAGDVDYTWDYHMMMNVFRSNPKNAGWLYTQHHDVINEWNGYVKYDRSPKIDGLSELVPGMTLADFHAPFYLSPQLPLCSEVSAGSTVHVPLYRSYMTDCEPGRMKIETQIVGWNTLGEYRECSPVVYDEEPGGEPYFMGICEVEPTVQIPKENGLYIYRIVLKDNAGEILHRNFVCFVVKDGSEPAANAPGFTSIHIPGIGYRKIAASELASAVTISPVKTVTFAPDSFVDQKWQYKQWNVLDGLKVNGAGHGYFDYEIAWPEEVTPEELAGVKLRFEASAKQLFGKDIAGVDSLTELEIVAGGGTNNPTKSMNAYAMTDLDIFDSWVRVWINDRPVGMYNLKDDPADHRGILSWFAQPHDNLLREAGSYGYLIDADLPLDFLTPGKPIRIRFEVPEEIGKGLALYGKDFGRYPLDPTLLFIAK